MHLGRQRVWVVESSTAERRTILKPKPPPPPKLDVAPLEVRPGARAASLPRPERAPDFALPGARSGPGETPRGGRRKWIRLSCAYLLGPLAPLVLLRGPERVFWSACGLVASAGGLWSFAHRDPFMIAIGGTGAGAGLFAGVAALLVLAITVVWCRSIAAVKFARSKTDSYAARRNPFAFALIGLLVPGLGLHLAGHPKRAAWAFGVVGTLVANLVLLGNWRWLCRSACPPESNAIAGAGLEFLLATAAVGFALGCVVWLVQALDGARRVAAPAFHRPSSFVSAALLVALVIFSTTFRPGRLAVGLQSAADSLHHEGLARIPLVLCYVAGRLDPGSPRPIARSAELLAALGMTEQASERRQLLQERAREYVALAGLRARSSSGSLRAVVPEPRARVEMAPLPTR